LPNNGPFTKNNHKEILSSGEREGNPSSNSADFFILFYFEKKPFFQKLPFVLKDSLHYPSLDLGFKEGLLIFLLA
jgi:hypothetical protein